MELIRATRLGRPGRLRNAIQHFISRHLTFNSDADMSSTRHKYGKLPYDVALKEFAMSPIAATTARLEARISFDLHATLKRAAELQGRTMTDFVVSAVQEAAQKAIEQAEVIRLSLADQQCFAQALLSPPEPTPALQRAFARRQKLSVSYTHLRAH